MQILYDYKDKLDLDYSNFIEIIHDNKNKDITIFDTQYFTITPTLNLSDHV